MVRGDVYKTAHVILWWLYFAFVAGSVMADSCVCVCVCDVEKKKEERKKGSRSLSRAFVSVFLGHAFDMDRSLYRVVPCLHQLYITRRLQCSSWRFCGRLSKSQRV